MLGFQAFSFGIISTTRFIFLFLVCGDKAPSPRAVVRHMFKTKSERFFFIFSFFFARPQKSQLYQIPKLDGMCWLCFWWQINVFKNLGG